MRFYWIRLKQQKHTKMSLKTLTVILSLLMFLIVIELIRRERINFKYASGWMLVSILAIFLTVFDTFLFQAADFLGFELASNFIFFTLLSVFVFLSLLMTIFLCQQNERNDKMAQKIGMLELEVEQLKHKFEKDKK